MIKTVNRGYLKRQVQKGLFEAQTTFRFDSHYELQDEYVDKWIPARLSAGYGDFKEGYYNLTDFDFRTKSGCAYISSNISKDNDIISLHIHSNHIVALRLIKKEEKIE